VKTNGKKSWPPVLVGAAGGEPTKSIVYFFGRVSLQSLFGRINFQFQNLLADFSLMKYTRACAMLKEGYHV
jgi:hypothetical protein